MNADPAVAPGDGPSPTPPGAGQAEPPPPPTRRTRVAILLTFLGAFLLLIVVFRAVLFPFLIAIFIAYLIEPVVAAFTRAPVFGIRWTRGPTIVLMYAIVLGLIGLGLYAATTSVLATGRELSRDVTRALAEKGEAAYFGIAEKEPTFGQDVRIPAGTRVVLEPYKPPKPPEPVATKDTTNEATPLPDTTTDAPQAPGKPPAGPQPLPPVLAVFETYHDALLHEGEREVRIILKHTTDPVPSGGVHGDILSDERIKFVDDSALPAGRRLTVTGAPNARGLDLWLEKNLIGPIVKNLAAVGYKAEPTTLREFIGEQAEALNATLRGWLERSGRVAITVGKSLYMFLLILMLTAFIVMDRARISAFFASLPPDHLKPEYASLMGYVDRGLAGVIRGQLVICAVNGVLTYIGLVILGVRGAALLSLVAGILSLIPIFGTIVSSIPIVLVAATSSLTTGVLALGWIGLIHLVEANLLNPLIMGSHANMHPVIIIFALLAGEHAFGVWGALLAVPTMSIIQSCFLFYRHEIEGLPRSAEAAHGAWLRNAFRRLFSRKPAPAPGAPPHGTMPAPRETPGSGPGP